jgi:group I intron endonuclease
MGVTHALPEKPYGIIYCATNRTNGKRYVGQTTGTLLLRKSGHGTDAKRQTHRFARAINKYGVDGFEWEEIDTGFSIEELNYMEEYWISYHDSTHRERGYNILKGGNNRRMDEELRQKLSKTLKQTFLDGRIHPHLGKTPPKERIDKQSRSLRATYAAGLVNPRKGVRLSPLTKNKIKISKGGVLREKKSTNIGQHNSPRTEFPSVPIRCIETGQVYKTVSEAAKAFDISHTNFASYWRGSRKTVAGLHWEKVI